MSYELKCVFVVVLFAVCVFASDVEIDADIFSEIDARHEHRIVGGYDAGRGGFPYQVSMRHQNRHFCGGSIIDKYWILTAAHCIHNQQSVNMSAVVGTNYLKMGGISYPVAKLFPHPDYAPATIINDIGLVKLKLPLQFRGAPDPIKPIALHEDVINGDGKKLILSGWGTTSYPGSPPNNLKMIILHSINNAYCKAVHSPRVVTYANVCTYNGEGQGACHGDSGGPLVYENKQVGVVSWGIPCAKGKPDVFTGVHYYLHWIKTQMEEN